MHAYYFYLKKQFSLHNVFVIRFYVYVLTRGCLIMLLDLPDQIFLMEFHQSD